MMFLIVITRTFEKCFFFRELFSDMINFMKVKSVMNKRVRDRKT